jgi:restriction system protein
LAVPDYQTLMLPVLQVAGDGQEHMIGQTIEIIASSFGLTDEDRNELLPSGTQFRFENRVHWARSYLKHAALVESTGRGKFRITQRGLQVLESNPTYINVKYLDQFPEFREFKSRSTHSQIPQEIEAESVHTPEENLEESYQSLRDDLALELIDRVMACSPRFFEN